MPRKPSPGADLAARHPDVARQWHPTRNGDLRPDMVTAGSGAKVWWACDLGHAWEATVNNRRNGTGCPYCSNTRVLAGFNDLATRFPDVAKQWHPTRNGHLTPAQVAPSSSKKVWWSCDQGHEFAMTCGNRTFLGQGCPVCAGQRVLAGVNDMATTAPDLAAQWHPTRNGDLTPRNVFRSTAKEFWWRCPEGHDWQASANERSNGSGCPYCSGQRILVGFNDLGSVRPDLAREWDTELNGDRTPAMVTVSNGTKAWWRDDLGHSWQAVIASRSAGTGCPVCAGQTVVAGFNDLASQQPDVAASWHPDRNPGRAPQDTAVYSNKITWWRCPKGHEWTSTVNNRSHGQGCPECAEGGGFNPGKAGYVYVLEHPVLAALKVGITNVGTTRLARFRAIGGTWSTSRTSRAGKRPSRSNAL